jgi:hypothetical protein
MYEFAVVALLGLATYKVVDLLTELVPSLTKVRSLATFVLAVLAVVALDYSVFAGFGITVREQWIGTVVTGLIVGSLAAAWQALLGWLGTHEVATGERRHTDRPRIAA